MSRIAVTGLGAVAPIGVGIDEFHRNLSAGRDGVTEMTFPWGTGARVNRAGLLPNFDIEQHLPGAAAVARASQFSLAAVREALDQAGLNGSIPAHRKGVIVGTAMGDTTSFEDDWQRHQVSPTNGRVDDRWMRLGNMSDCVAEAFGFEGPSHVVAAACAGGNQAIAWAEKLLKRNRADAVVAVGSDSIGYVSMLGFNRLRLQSPDRCRPFDRRRAGTILAEGAGALVLERLDVAKRRGALILAELGGCGVSSDAEGPFASRVADLRGLHVAVNRALRASGVPADAIDHVSAHGTGTKLNDRKETLLLKEVLGPRAYQVPVTSIKAMFGHAQGAAPSLEAVAAILSLQTDVIYPTTNYENPDPECDLDYVPNQAREQRVNTILSNSFGIGGNNAIVVFKRWNGN